MTTTRVLTATLLAVLFATLASSCAVAAKKTEISGAPARQPATPSTSLHSGAAARAKAPACRPTAPLSLATTGQAQELILVEAPSYSTSYATLSAWNLKGSCWTLSLGPWSARIGVNGFSDHHEEGDGTTPTGAYGFGSVIYGIDSNPGVHYQYHQLVCGDWWDEDPNSTSYNTFEHVPCGEAPPFGGNSEALWEESSTYSSFAVIDYNVSPVIARAGSAIFLHVDDGSATAGCVSVPLAELDRLLQWLTPSASPMIVMGPSSEIDSF
jgi:L,D-peptidoglycan transpeptidase YkuD (ErfK/YbiS/YcfS/YnhG family)